jgi:molybdate transport system substrate-binding protein
MRRIWLIAGVALLVSVTNLTACGSGSSSQSIVVLAAASLRPTFSQIGERFKADNPGVGVLFDFASSSDLATQMTSGAAADVFASADTAQMARIAKAGLIGRPVDFASNTLVIVTAPGNPKNVESFADLARPGLKVVISPPPMPCGVATRRVENSTGVHLNPVSEEPDVEDVLNKVAIGEADAGLVNLTDAVSAGEKVTTVKFPEAAGAVNVYPIAVLKKAPHPQLAQKFVELVTGQQGQKILDQAGFGKP